MRFKKRPQLPGAGRTRVGHHHGSHTTTSPGTILLGKMAYHTKQIRRQCMLIHQAKQFAIQLEVFKKLSKISHYHLFVPDAILLITIYLLNRDKHMQDFSDSFENSRRKLYNALLRSFSRIGRRIDAQTHKPCSKNCILMFFSYEHLGFESKKSLCIFVF